MGKHVSEQSRHLKTKDEPQEFPEIDEIDEESRGAKKADWVLSAFKDQDAVDMRDAALRAAHAAECYITDGADRAMNRFN